MNSITISWPDSFESMDVEINPSLIDTGTAAMALIHALAALVGESKAKIVSEELEDQLFEVIGNHLVDIIYPSERMQ